MPRFSLALLAVTLAVVPARADSILYATAATANRIDGFCLRANGALAPTPSHQATTGGAKPRRVLVANGVLYVAEVDRVEAFRIGPGGGLKLIGNTKVQAKLDPHDIALSLDLRTLYVPDRGNGLLLAHPIGDDGAPAKDFTSCIQGDSTTVYETMLPTLMSIGPVLYLSSESSPGRVDVFRLPADGVLPNVPADSCRGVKGKKTRPAATVANSSRSKLPGPRALVLTGNSLFVESTTNKRIFQFALDENGDLPCPTLKDGSTAPNGTVKCPCPPETTTKCPSSNVKKAPPEARTAVVLAYNGLVLQDGTAGTTILGSQFFQGRIDAYTLKDGVLPKHPTRVSQADVRTSPVRMTIVDGVLYVAAGEDDRVHAYRLRASDGTLATTTPFSKTDVQTGSFPNDVTVAMLTGGCH